jgi:hypothetical protein
MPMTIRGGWLTGLTAIVLGLPMLYVALCFGIYAWAGRDVPATIPASSLRAPDTVRAQYLAIEVDGATRMRRLNPVTFWPTMIANLHRNGRQTPPDLQLLHRATWIAQRRDAHRRSQGESHASSIAYTIDVGRQWTFDQAVDTILAESDFGRDSIGIEAAAQAYFGVRAAELRPQESLALIVLMRGPAWYDMACRRERFDRRYAWAADRLGQTGPEWTTTAALARLRPRTCA